MNKENVVVPDGAHLESVEPAESGETGGAERRRYLRVKPDVLSAMLVVDGTRHVVAIRDISTGGARIVNAPHGLKRDDCVELIARLEHETLDLACRVAWVDDGLISPAIGVEFMNVDSENTQKLLSYVSLVGMEVVHR